MRRFDGHLARSQQRRWRSDSRPIATLEPGETIEVEVPDSSTDQLGPDSTRADLARLDLERVDAAVGPFAVRGAAPGDAITVRIDRVDIGSWGWSGVFRHFGLLRGRFSDDLVVWRRQGRTMVPVRGFLRRVPVPVQPMVGWVGLAPAHGDYGMIPPRRHGGNLDNRLHRPGTTLALPVQRTGGHLMVGDTHAAQGDGEVCGTGIEVPARLRLTIGLVPGGATGGPSAEALEPPSDGGRRWVTEGIGSDPRRAARAATEAMIDRMAAAGLSAKEAYLLLSLVGQLRLSQVVDEPRWTVSMVVSEAFVRGAAQAPPTPRG